MFGLLRTIAAYGGVLQAAVAGAVISTVVSVTLCPAEAAIQWGANGHPITGYPAGVTPEQQLSLLADLGLKIYRVDITNTDQMDRLARLIAIGRERGVTILPILIPPTDLEKDTPEDLYAKSRDFAQTFLRRFSAELPVWELGNELENFAIIKSCEIRDDGTQYPCEWGPAGGVGPLEYVGARYRKVAAVLRGLSEGVRAISATARRAIGSAGWGHVGVFDRFQEDGIGWDISVWHMYAGDQEWALKKLATFGKPIWVTEFNHPEGSGKDGEGKQAEGLLAQMRQLAALSDKYHVEAAIVYELLDEAYWAPSFEASMGLVRLDKQSDGGWRLGPTKAAYPAMRDFIGHNP